MGLPYCPGRSQPSGSRNPTNLDLLSESHRYAGGACARRLHALGQQRRGPGNRALGWEMRDTTSADNSGTLLSALAYGHTGYTGTSIWIDPELDLFVIVLTNRVFAPRTRNSITQLKRIRGRVADAAVELRQEMCSSGSALMDQC